MARCPSCSGMADLGRVPADARQSRSVNREPETREEQQKLKVPQAVADLSRSTLCRMCGVSGRVLRPTLR